MAFLPLLLDNDGFVPPMVSQGTHWDTLVRAAGSLCLVFGGDWQDQTRLVHGAPGCWVRDKGEPVRSQGDLGQGCFPPPG